LRLNGVYNQRIPQKLKSAKINFKKTPTGLFTRSKEPKSVALSKVQRSKMFRVGVWSPSALQVSAALQHYFFWRITSLFHWL